MEATDIWCVLSRSSFKVGTTLRNSKTKGKRMKELSRWIVIVISWCFCILSLRNFRDQIIHLRTNDARLRGLPRILFNPSRPRATDLVENTGNRITSLNAMSLATNVQLVQKSQQTTKSSKSPRVKSTFANFYSLYIIKSCRFPTKPTEGNEI